VLGTFVRGFLIFLEQAGGICSCLDEAIRHWTEVGSQPEAAVVHGFLFSAELSLYWRLFFLRGWRGFRVLFERKFLLVVSFWCTVDVMPRELLGFYVLARSSGPICVESFGLFPHGFQRIW